MAFYEGQPVNGFSGLKSPEEIKAFFDEIISVSSVSSDMMNDLNKKLELAETSLEKNVEEAIEMFSELITPSCLKMK